MFRRSAVAATVALLTLGCTSPPSLTSNSPTSNIKRQDVINHLIITLREVSWAPVTGPGHACTDGVTVKRLTPYWALVTLSDAEKSTIEANPTLSTPVFMPITPSISADIKRLGTREVDTTLLIDNLSSMPVPKAPKDDAKALSELIGNEEKALVNAGDGRQPCLGVNNITITTAVDITQQAGSEVKFGFGPFVAADFKQDVNNEAIATLKIEIHYVPSGAPTKNAAPLGGPPRDIGNSY